MLVRRLDLTSLRLFVAVCEETSIARAAEREFTAASAISKRIADMEDTMGVSLLYRHQKGVSPTKAGETVLEHARTIIRTVERMSGDLSEYCEGLAGNIRIYANLSSIVEFLPEDLSSFCQTHSKIKIELEEHVSDAVVRGVEEGMTDIGICCETTLAKGLQSFPYRADRVVAVVREDHPLAGKASIQFRETLDFEHVALQTGSALYDRLSHAATELGKPIKIRIQTSSFDAVCRMVEARMGMGILPESVVKPYEKIAGLRCIPLEDAWANRWLKIVVREFLSLPVAARMLVQYLARDRTHDDIKEPTSEPVTVTSR